MGNADDRGGGYCGRASPGARLGGAGRGRCAGQPDDDGRRLVRLQQPCACTWRRWGGPHGGRDQRRSGRVHAMIAVASIRLRVCSTAPPECAKCVWWPGLAGSRSVSGTAPPLREVLLAFLRDVSFAPAIVRRAALPALPVVAVQAAIPRE